jgi:hypothetical protein
MKSETPVPGEPTGRFGTFAAEWTAFWFTPRNPTILGVMRVMIGMVTLYTFIVHSITINEFMGPDAWCDITLRREVAKDRPMIITSLLSSPNFGGESVGRIPIEEPQKTWAEHYKRTFGVWPPEPHPETQEQANEAFQFRQKWGFDFRYYGLPFPKDKRERDIRDEYVLKHGSTFPPPYPKDEKQLKEIEDYFEKHGQDPRLLYSRGTPIFSVWMDVLDPTWMRIIQYGFVFAALCFVLGLGTRVTSVIVWFANLCYIHRNPHVLFGVDTMMNVILLYLMIGPSGAAVSLDRFIAKWWNPKTPDEPEPRISANIAIRLLQIHLCIIYFIAGISKLQGNTWWTGTAVWSVLGNYEFAPMNIPFYNDVLRWLGQNQLLFESIITSACIFTIAFEIGYPFLIWRPRTRWVFLAGAIFLHGFIGLFMGLKTFSLTMLVFNVAFLTDREIASVFRWLNSEAPTPSEPPRQTSAKRRTASLSRDASSPEYSQTRM